MRSARAAFSRNAGCEERALGHAVDQEVVQVVRRDRDQVDGRWRVGVGQPDRDAVVGPERLDLDAERLAHPPLDRERPRRVDAAAERREDADPPVADLVAEALDDDGAVGRDHAGGGLLVVEVVREVGGRQLVEVAEPAGAGRLADGPAELVGPSDPVALPERHPARHARRRRHQHPVAGDLLDPPRRRPELEDLAGAGLVDHLLVELAHPCAGVGQEDAVEPAVRDRPARRDRQPAGVVAPADDAGGPVPDHPRPKLRELVGRIAPGQHVEHALELRAAEIRVGRRPRDHRVQVVDRPVVHHRGRDELLGEHVERLARDAGVLDRALAHPADDDGRLEQVAAVLGEEAAVRGGVDVMAGPPDPLEAGGHRLRRLHLHDEVDRAHVDPELERRGGDERRQPSGLEHLLDLEPLLAGYRAVVGARDLLLGEVVQAVGDALGRTAAVHEDEGRAMGANELEQARVDRRPDRLARLAVGGRGAAQLTHVGDGNDDLQVERLSMAGIDDLDRAVAAQEAGDLVERPLGRREPDPLRVAAGQVGQPLQRERQMRAALPAGQRVDLVDDDRLDAGQHLARRRGQDQVERLGRRDQDVGRPAPHRRPLALRRVAASHRHLDRARGLDAVKRRAQVPLDVVV